MLAISSQFQQRPATEPPVTEHRTGQRSPHPFAPYRDSDFANGSPYYALYAAANPRFVADTRYVDGKPHAAVEFAQVKYYDDVWSGRVTAREHGVTRPGDLPRTEQQIDKHLSLTELDGAIQQANEGLALTRGRDIAESMFTTSRYEAQKLFDSMKATELLVQTVRDGALTTKVVDTTALDPKLAAALGFLKQ
ncbi:MAG: hypothetical protein JWN41_371 [Thermoleophilia bacterium]|nr:hypothetical protein [Thermoleophilia bacterium]